jgi:tetratricopeptide (TPR) repeat protein
MNLKTIFTAILFFLSIVLINAQSPEILARSAMLNAEESYKNGEYKECYDYLAVAEKNLGKTNSAIQYLKIKTFMVLASYDQYNKDLWLSVDRELKSFFEVTPDNSYVPEKYEEMLLAVSKVKKYISEADEGKARETQNKIDKYTAIINTDPTNIKAYSRRASLLFSKEDYTSAIQDYNKIIGIDKKNVDAFIRRAEAKYYLFDYQGAIQDYSKAVELNPSDASLYQNRGVAKSYLKDYQGAIQDYSKAIELNPSSPDLYQNRGAAKSYLKDYQGAIQDYSKAIELNPGNADLYLNRIYSKKELKDYDGIIKDYSKIIELYPDYTDGYYERGKIYQLQLKNIPAAKKDFEYVIKLNSDSIYIAFSYYFMGNKEKAISIFKEMLRRVGNNINEKCVIYYSQARLFSLDGNKSEAIKLLNSVVLLRGTDYYGFGTEDDFDNIRNSPEFIEIINKFKK